MEFRTRLKVKVQGGSVMRSDAAATTTATTPTVVTVITSQSKEK